jgi:hypothetical protein
MFLRLGVSRFDSLALRENLEKDRALIPSATHPEGIMLHGEDLSAVVFSGTGIDPSAVGIALESGGYISRM